LNTIPSPTSFTRSYDATDDVCMVCRRDRHTCSCDDWHHLQETYDTPSDDLWIPAGLFILLVVILSLVL
jgi:hypothetical protein